MSLIVEGKRRQAENDHADRAWLAWTTAALQRGKRMPSLADLIQPRKRAKQRGRRKRAEQLMTMANMWAAATGRANEET